MFSDFKKSIDGILNDRLTSPFWGTLILSWLIWNWKIWYVTLVISENVAGNKIDYILANCNNINCLIIGPVVSTLAIITVIPFISNGAYWISIKFDKWKLEKKNEVDKKTVLSVEQSIEIREQMTKREEWIQKLIETKDAQIRALEIELEDVRTTANNTGAISTDKIDLINIARNLGKKYSDNEIDKTIEAILNNQVLSKSGITADMLKLDLVAYKRRLSSEPLLNDDVAKYSLTRLGERFRSFYYQEYSRAR